MKKSSRVVSTLLLGATVASASTGVFAVESKEIIKDKLAGETRFETAVKVSEKFGKADTVVLVNYTGIADALAATPLAKMKNAPILLTEAGSLTKATADQIAKLEAKKVIVIGGENAVSKNVVKQLEELKLDVERVAGEDRYATSEEVAKAMGDVEEVAVVNGIKGLADALSVAAPAAKEGMAIVLSDGTSVRAGQKVLDKAKTKYVIGGETVVSKELTEKLGAERLAGANRNATNAEVLNKFYSQEELDKVYVAKDGAVQENHLVDALAAGPLAGKEGNPVILAGSDLDKAQEAYLKDRIAKSLVEVGEGINQNTVSAIVKALTVKEETPSDKAEITGVEVLNASQIKFKFSQKVDKDSAEEIENYEVKKDGESANLIDADNYAPTKGKDAKDATAEVQEDGQTVVVTLPQAYLGEKTSFFNQETVRVKVENVMSENKNEVFEKYENKKVKLFDNTLPELKEVRQVGPKDFDLVFSEPVTAESSSAIVSAIRIDGGKYSCTAKTRVDNNTEAKKIDANVVRITTPSEVEEGNHTLTIKENKLMDYAGLKLEAVDTKFEAKKATNDLTASVYKTSGKTITLNFNREVENAETEGKDKNTNVSYYLDYENEAGYKAETAVMEDGKLVLTFKNDIPSGDHKVLVVYNSEKKDKVQDLWEQELASREINFTVAKDTVAPKATVSYNKNDKKIEVKFSKKVDIDEATKVANYQLKDEKGNYKNIGEITQKEGNSLVYRIDAKDLSGKYTLTIKGNKIHDTSVERNALKECSFELDTLDSLAPSIASVRYGGDKDVNKIYVEYSEDMKTDGEGSILDKSLYHLKYTQDTKNDANVDKTLDEIEDAKIELEGNNGVVITLPDNIVGDAPIVKVGRVCDANGNFVAINGIKYILGSGETAVNDNVITLLKGSDKGDGVDDTDVLDLGASVNVTDTNEMEVYVQGKVTSVVADNINVTVGGKDYKATKAKSESCTLKVAEGQYVEATKLTVEVKDDVFVRGAKPTAIKFAADALTTNLETKTVAKSIDLAVSNKKVVKYVDDSARMIIEKNEKGENIAKEVRFEVTTPVKNVNKDTFKVDGYNVDSAKTEEDGYVVVLTLDGKSTCEPSNEADIDVELAQAIYDINDNKTEKMDVFQIDIVEYAKKEEAKIEAIKELAAITGKKSEIKLPEKVTVVYSDKTEKELAVKWDKTVDALVEGENKLEGTVEGTELKANLTVTVEKEAVVDPIEAIRNAASVDVKAGTDIGTTIIKVKLADDVDSKKYTISYNGTELRYEESVKTFVGTVQGTITKDQAKADMVIAEIKTEI